MLNPQTLLVLVADRDPSTLESMARHLRAMDDPRVEVLEAHDGETALRLALGHRPDLVVLDALMAKMSGYEVCREIRKSDALTHTGIVMLTGLPSSVPIYGEDASIAKPFEVDVFDRVVKRVLESRAVERKTSVRRGREGSADATKFERGARVRMSSSPPGRVSSAFQQVSLQEFDSAMARAKSSDALKRQLARFRPSRDEHCFVHDGPLRVDGNFKAPGFCTLVNGDLDVTGLIDLENPETYDEGGMFVAIGDVTCRGFANHYGKCTFIEGNLIARDVIVNSYGDSSLIVIGSLKTKFFYGLDIWAEVGGAADMEYGNGYCLPIGYTNAAAQAIRPKHDASDSLARLALANPEGDFLEGELVNMVREGRSILK